MGILLRRRKATPWTAEEDRRLVEMVNRHGAQNWRTIANGVGSRTPAQVAQRWRKTLNPDLLRVNKGKWTKAEDELLRQLIETHTDNNWQVISEGFGGTRTVKHCRERWLKHIAPDLKRNVAWTVDEDTLLLLLRRELGYNGWAEIARSLPGRTDNAVKRRYRSLTRLGTAAMSSSSSSGGGAGGGGGDSSSAKGGGVGDGAESATTGTVVLMSGGGAGGGGVETMATTAPPLPRL